MKIGSSRIDHPILEEPIFLFANPVHHLIIRQQPMLHRCAVAACLFGLIEVVIDADKPIGEAVVSCL